MGLRDVLLAALGGAVWPVEAGQRHRVTVTVRRVPFTAAALNNLAAWLSEMPFDAVKVHAVPPWVRPLPWSVNVHLVPRCTAIRKKPLRGSAGAAWFEFSACALDLEAPLSPGEPTEFGG